ncbi:MAG: bifunctional ADP-dependent NAD(P)H-hydrate dehydratase/NAD(P)H-hydrate epimerase [Opitutales bacterium]|nr:bifunctional ADP-dependent NAD(P)H-hydrate dehydratase/NAD(P)H-hydrate epimerase [Opitutales bacterium]
MHFLPVMTCARARAWEKRFFDPLREHDGAPPRERDFMRRAGTRIAETVLDELRGVPAQLLVLIGKGHNGGDAIIAAGRLLDAWSGTAVKFVFFADGWDALAPLTMDAYEDFLRRHKAPPSLFYRSGNDLSALERFVGDSVPAGTALMLDGIYGSSFRAPLREDVAAAFVSLNRLCARMLRVAVDLPSGLGDTSPCGNALVADITCAAGIVKTPLLDPANAAFVGRVVPCAIGFPCDDCDSLAADPAHILEILTRPRPAVCDKRDFGKILIVGGSRRFAGALMMNVLAALRAGTGLVTAFCPESVHAAFVARVPAAMWIPCKETADGDLEFADVARKLDEGKWLDGETVRTVLCGSGIGRSPDAQAVVQKIAAETRAPARLVLDADAIFPQNLKCCALRRERDTFILPHEGEFARVADCLNCQPGQIPQSLHKSPVSGVIKKGRFTWVASAQSRPVLCCTGTPVLARGGSGDLLAGTVAGLLAQFPQGFSYEPEKSDDCRDLLVIAACWHGLAGQALQRQQGERCADISRLPEFFNEALRKD